MGEGGEISELSCQFRAPNLKGQIVSARGVVTAVYDDDEHKRTVELDLWTEDQDGTKLAAGTASVVFPLP